MLDENKVRDIILESDEIKTKLNITDQLQIKSIGFDITGDQVFLILTHENQYLFKYFASNSPSADLVKKHELASKNMVGPQLYFSANDNNYVILENLISDPISSTEEIESKLADFLKKLHKIELGNDIKDVKDIDLEKIISKNLDKISEFELSDELDSLIFNLRNSLDHQFSFPKRVFCHNDLNPSNLIFKKEGVKGLDWASSGINNFYYDLAAICCWFCETPQNENNLFKNYLGSEPTQEQIDDLNAMKNIYKTMVASGFILKAIKLNADMVKHPTNTNLTLTEFLTDVNNGKRNFANSNDLFIFGIIWAKLVV